MRVRIGEALSDDCIFVERPSKGNIENEGRPCVCFSDCCCPCRCCPYCPFWSALLLMSLPSSCRCWPCPPCCHCRHFSCCPSSCYPLRRPLLPMLLMLQAAHAPAATAAAAARLEGEELWFVLADLCRTRDNYFFLVHFRSGYNQTRFRLHLSRPRLKTQLRPINS